MENQGHYGEHCNVEKGIQYLDKDSYPIPCDFCGKEIEYRYSVWIPGDFYVCEDCAKKWKKSVE